MDLWSFFSRELWLFLLLGIILGLAVPQVGQYVTPYAIYFLLVVMFFTSLEISLGDVKKALGNKRFVWASLFLVYVVSPLIGLFLSFFLSTDLALGLILYSAMPSAMASAFYLKRMKKEAALSLVMTALTTLLAPFVTPIIVTLLSGHFITIDPIELFLSLIKIIIIPFAVAEAIQRLKPSLALGILKKSPPINSVCIFFVVFGVISAAAGQVWSMGGLGLIYALYFTTVFGLGYFFGGKNRLEMAFVNGFKNSTLVMVVAFEVFGPTVAMVPIVATVLHTAVLVPMLLIKDKKSF